MMRSSDIPETRRLAQQLLAYEAVDGVPATVDSHAICRVCDKIRRPLTTLAGASGFRSLLSRSLALAKQESPAFGGWEVGPDGSLQGLDRDTAESGGVLIAQLIGLMITFIGETLTHRLLHDVWLDLPDAELMFERNKLK